MNYDNIAEQYEKWNSIATTDWKLGYKNVAKLLQPIRDKKVLDYGCGNGRFSVYLQKLGATVVGVDISARQLEMTEKSKNKNILYLLDTDPKIETEYTDYFDAAVLNFVLCEISSEESILSVLKRVYTLLKQGGELVILNPNWDKSNGRDFLNHKMQYAPELKLGGSVTTILKDNPPIHIPDYYWSKDFYVEMLEKTGFGDFEISEPLAPDDGTSWKDEKEYPPYFIIKVKKLGVKK